MTDLIIAFVHGYSVTRFETYGELPLRIKNEAMSHGFNLRIEEVFLGRYITFHDKVQLKDVSMALNQAIKQQIPKGKRFVVITHSTGAPLVRTWWRDFYKDKKITCPMSHLIMLAPANHGSALAQLGKSRLSRVRSWFDGLEPGQGILNWLELGSAEAWRLNQEWISNGAQTIDNNKVFPFVITGQDIDRKLYDHINSYTGETGSDGVIRVASANLNSAYVKLEQQVPLLTKSGAKANNLVVAKYFEAVKTPLRIVRNSSHSGNEMGIMRSVKKETNDKKSKELIDSIFDCINVSNQNQYNQIYKQFQKQTDEVQVEQQVETIKKSFANKQHIHDRYAMVIFRLQDTEGNPVTDFDLIITGNNDDPDQLPSGFFADRQFNHATGNTLSYYFNYDLMHGSAAVKDASGKVIRAATKGLQKLGLKIIARPLEGFVRYLPCQIAGTKELFSKIIRKNSTTLIDIYLQRIVSEENFRFEKTSEKTLKEFSFKDIKAGDKFVPLDTSRL